MIEDEQNRLVAWDRELTAAHQRLRRALRIARDSLDEERISLPRDLALYCRRFCVALTGHHVSEGSRLFPELTVRYPALGPVIAKLEQDHDIITELLTQLDQAIRSAASPAELMLHLDGVGAIMESHFQYEERQLLSILETLDVHADPHAMFGPL